MSEMLRHDAEDKQRTAAHPRTSAWVTASAGTGKTKVLTDRVLNLLLSGSLPERILCLTFTKAAAAEMSTRLAKRLSDWAIADEATLRQEITALSGQSPDADTLDRARRLFARVLDTPGGMKIETIHAFGQSLLRRFPLEAGISPHFEVLDDRDSADLLTRARDAVLTSKNPTIQAALNHLTALVHEQKFPELLATITAQSGKIRRMFEGFKGRDRVETALRQRLGLTANDTPDSLRLAACEESAVNRAALVAMAEAFETDGTATDKKNAVVLRQWLGSPDGKARVTRWSEYLSIFLTNEGAPRSQTRFPGKDVKTKHPAVLTTIDHETERLLRVETQWRAAMVGQATSALLTVADAMLEAYRSAKKQRGRLDYDDLITATRRLLSTVEATQWVLYKLDGGLDHILVDEAQDTNPDQWAVISALWAEFFAGDGARLNTRTVFVVGDRKQSIYSFQGADPEEFDRQRQRVESAAQEAEQRFANVGLDLSFRSTSAVLTLVDQVFAQAPATEGVVLPDEILRHLVNRQGQGGRVELWPPVEPIESEPPTAWLPPVAASKDADAAPVTRLARLIARRIAWMIESGQRLESRGRAVRAGDVLVLVRRRGPFVDDLVRALKTLGVPVSGADRMVLTDQLAVMDLVALGHALLLPEDDLTLATVLKSPLLGLDEEALFTLAHNRPRGVSVWQRLREASEHAGIFREAYEKLSEWRRRADFLPPHELFAEVLGPGQGRHNLLARLGPEAADPIDEFVALTLAYDRSHAPSLQGFLHWLAADEQTLKRDLEESGDRVRVMTVHGSKGLQASVVILPDTRQVPKQTETLFWEDAPSGPLMVWVPKSAYSEPWSDGLRRAATAAQEREYNRLLYVALTRAEDWLIVGGWSGKQKAPEACWYNQIERAMRATAQELRDDWLAREGLEPIHRLDSEQTEKPDRDSTSQTPLHGAAMVLPEWITHPAPAEPTPPRPLAPSRPVSETPPARSPLHGSDESRFQRGRLVHRLLQFLPDLPTLRRADAARAFLNRPLWNLPEGERDALIAETLAVLDDPRFAPLFGPGSVAEASITGLIGGFVVSGQVDRLLVTPEAVLIVDYKTNRPPPRDPKDVPALYRQQMAAYRAVLGGLYEGRVIECGLLWTDGPFLLALPETDLEAALAEMLMANKR